MLAEVRELLDEDGGLLVPTLAVAARAHVLQELGGKLGAEGGVAHALGRQDTPPAVRVLQTR